MIILFICFGYMFLYILLFRQTSQSRVFDPYEQVRGGTGYNFDFEQPTSRPPTSQPSMGRYQSPQMLNSYPYSQQMPHQGMPQGKENYLKLFNSKK